MLREFKAGIGKVVHTDYKANSAMKTGMVVVLDENTKEAKFPAAPTADGLYFVDKERVPTGYNTARGDMSDYDENFINVEAGEFVKLKNYREDAVIGVDCKGSAAPTAGNVVAAGTDGKLIDAPDTVPSRYLYLGDVLDNGHTLMKIKVLDAPIKNSVVG